nr:MAG TPA: hypothetical protein [Caudoviricetes sp.]
MIHDFGLYLVRDFEVRASFLFSHTIFYSRKYSILTPK